MYGESLSLFATPEARPVRRLRPYQAEAQAGIRSCLERHRSTVAVLFTGGGKTTLAAQAAIEAPGRVLFLAHLDALVQQARAELSAVTGMRWELEQGEWRAARRGSTHVVASVQTLMRQRRLSEWAPDAFSLIVVDEAHHYVAKSFKRPLDYFASAKILALTATPDRADRKALGRYVESVAYKMDLTDGIQAGWSVPIDCRPPLVCDVDLGKVKVTKAGDYDPDALDDAMVEAIAPIVRAAMEHVGSAPTVIFTPGRKTAHAAAVALNRIRPGCAASVDGAMERREQRAAIAAWKAGKCQFMANCRVLTEGFDFKALAYMIDAAPTRSRALKAQKVGRLLRPLADVDAVTEQVMQIRLAHAKALGEIERACAEARKAAIAASPKPRAVWIDLRFNADDKALVTPTDVLGGSFTERERSRARKQIEKKGGDPLQALLEARARVAARAGRTKVKLELGSFDPTAPAEADGPATEGQLRRMSEMGIAAPAGVSRRKAQKLIGYEKLAEKKGWCDVKQRAWLQKNIGVSGRGMTVEKGRALADMYRANGKLRPTPEQVRAVIGGGR